MKSGNFVGLGVSNFPAPNEKSSVNPGGKITGTGTGGSVKSSSFTASFDSRPHPGDNKMGATRPSGGKMMGKSAVGKSGGYKKNNGKAESPPFGLA